MRGVESGAERLQTEKVMRRWTAERRRLELLSLKRLDEVLRYDPTTGFFTVLEASPGRKVGDVVGRPIRPGDNIYVMVYVDSQGYLAHRVAWYVFYRRLPRVGYYIDHINGKRGDNRIENLREVTPSQNAMNRGHDTDEHEMFSATPSPITQEVLNELFDSKR